MTPVLQPFLSETPAAAPKPRRAPVGTFSVARVSRNTRAPWSAEPAQTDRSKLPKGVVTSRKRSDMSRHATVVLA